MANTQSYQDITSLSQCMNQQTGEIDELLYMRYRRKKREALSEDDFDDLIALCDLMAQHEMNDTDREMINQRCHNLRHDYQPTDTMR